MTSNPASREQVEGALVTNGEYALNDTCDNLHLLVRALEQTNATFAIVDIDPNPVQILDQLRPVVDQFRETCFIALSSDFNHDLLFRAMHSGVRHVQARNRLKAELSDVLHRLAPAATLAAGQRGSVVTVLSASGGSGATTVAVNLANELHLSKHGRCLLIDLDYSYGAVSTYLELRGEYGIADVLAHDAAIDSHLINTTALRYSDHLYVLASPASIDLSVVHPLNPSKLASALDVCRNNFEFTVLDAPRAPMDVVFACAERSAAVLIVLQALVKDIRVAKSIAGALMDRGIRQDRITPVVNRYRKRHQMIGFDELTLALGDGFVIERASNDYPSAMRCINYGQPLSEAAPRSVLRHEIVQMAKRISESCGRVSAVGAAR
jgi:pilus assembly protein CpaE